MELIHKKRLYFLASALTSLLWPLLWWSGYRLSVLILYSIIPVTLSLLTWHYVNEHRSNEIPDYLLEEAELQRRNFRRGLKLAAWSILVAFIAVVLFALLILAFVSLMGKVRAT